MRVTLLKPNFAPRRAADAMQPLELALLAGLTPPDVEVEVRDERVEPLPAALETDLAAITVQTFTARRAYSLADELRARGVKVVLGGYHPTAMPAEAALHADAVVAGEAEHVWADVVGDARRGALAPVYRQGSPSSLEGLRYERGPLAGKRYLFVRPMELQRGCRYHCDFCSVTQFHGGTVRARPVREVVAEIEALGARTLLFVDDNLLGDRAWLKDMLLAIAPLRLRWGCQISTEVTRDPEILALMARAGCAAALVGFESLEGENLRQMRKPAKASTVAGHVERLHDHGIMVYASFVFGYDGDGPDVFDRTLEFARASRFFLANFNTLSPMPGTPLWERLRAEGRLLRDDWWLDPRFPYGEVAFRPARMSPEQLRDGCLRVRREFFGASSIAARLLERRANARDPGRALLYLAANWVCRAELRSKMREVGRAHP